MQIILKLIHGLNLDAGLRSTHCDNVDGDYLAAVHYPKVGAEDLIVIYRVM